MSLKLWKIQFEMNKVINNKIKVFLLFIMALLVIYIIWILVLIQINRQQIKLMLNDLDNKKVSRDLLLLRAEEIKNNKNIDDDLQKIDEIWKNLNINKDWKDLLISEISIHENKEFLFDLESDSSIQKFVTSTKSFDDEKYIPKDLVNISSEFVYDSKWWNQMVRKIANDNLQLMSNAFFEEFWEKITVVSAYRSYDYQVWIKKRWCADNFCAKAGYSEHQSWLALDLWDASTNSEWTKNQKLQKYFKWLNNNAYKYGFHNTYQKWLKIDWYEIEPWHWRYLWVELATYLKDNNLTIAEYYKQSK